MDRLTAQKLADTDQFGNRGLVNKINAMSSLARVLDGPPEKYKPVTLDTDKLNPFGMYRDYRTTYNSLYNEQPPKESELVIGRDIVKCPYEVLTALKSLALCGVCKSSQRAEACREVFSAILSRRKDSKLTLEMMELSLKPTGDYYKNEIIRAIIDSVYSPEDQIKMKIKSAMKDRYKEDMIYLFGETSDVVSFEEEVDRLYKKVCMDPDFKVVKSKGKIYNVVTYLNER